MLRLGHTMSTKKRKTTIALAAAAIASAAIAMMVAYPASYETIANAVSNAFGGVSRAFAAMSEYVQGAIASVQNLLGQQVV